MASIYPGTPALRHLCRMNCIFSVEGNLAFVKLSSPLRGGRFDVEAVPLQDLDTWYRDRYLPF